MVQIVKYLSNLELTEIVRQIVKDELNKKGLLHNEYLTRSETADLFRVSFSTLKTWGLKGILIPIKVGGKILYKYDDVKELEKLKTKRNGKK
jgi:hypothetical protein